MIVKYERDILDLLFKGSRVGKHPYLFLPFIPLEKMVYINIVMRKGSEIRSFYDGMVSQYPVTFNQATIDFCEGNQLLTGKQVQQIRS